MSAKLDVYHLWLGIESALRPPDHFTLLGVSRGESDIDKINAGAAARVKIVRPRCLKYPEQGTQLLNEIAQARICLTDEEERAAYDRDLQATSTQDLHQWARIHTTFTDLDVFNSDAHRDVGMATVPETEPDTYRIASPDPSPEASAGTRAFRPAEQGPQKRWCPHCGQQLLPRDTFCQSCSLSASISWLQFKCRNCDSRQVAGIVVCRKCKHDLAIHQAKRPIPKGVARNLPYHAAEQSNNWHTAQPAPPFVTGQTSRRPDHEEPFKSRFDEVEDKEKDDEEDEDERTTAGPSITQSIFQDIQELVDNFGPQVYIWILGAILLVVIFYSLSTLQSPR